MKSRILVIFVVFLMTWKEILNYEVITEKNLHEREKRYHESDHDEHLTRVKQDKSWREEKNVPTESTKLTNSDPQPQKTLPDISLVNSVPAKTITPRRKIVRINPLKNINTQRIKNTHDPYVMIANKKKDDSNGQQSKVNETLMNQVSEIKKEEKVQVVKEIVDTKTAKKTPSLDPTFRENEAVGEIIKVKSPEPPAVKSKTKSRNSKKESKIRKTFDINDDEIDPKTQEPGQNSKKYQPMPITQTTNSDTELEKQQDEIMDREEKISLNIEIEEDLAKKSTKPEKEKIQNTLINHLNDLNISSANNPNCTNHTPESKEDDSEVVIKKSEFDLDLQKSPQEAVENLESAGLIIKNKKYDEVVEYVHPLNAPPSYKLNTVQDYTDPVLDNDYQIPHFIYQELHTPEYDRNDYQNDNTHQPDIQQIEQIDGNTVVSYNNYFKMPTPTNSNNIRYTQPIAYQSMNTNRHCGYVPVRPNQISNNGWIDNRRHETQAVGDVDRIWKSWKNTEYYIKSKNAQKQIANEKFYNLVNQNNDGRRYIQRRDVGNGYYRIHNISPYL